MRQYTMAPRAVPLDDGWDVIVVGGGPAGCAAAAAAAREGARTLLIEAFACLGGMGTAGLLPVWCPFHDGEKVIYRGLAERVYRECLAGMPHIDERDYYFVPLDPERLKRIYDDLVLGHGAEILFNTMLSAVETDDDGVSVLLASNKSGLAAYRAKVYVDCTGDGDLSAWAGAAFQQGDEQTGETQPAGLCFIISNVDEYGFRTWPIPIGEILASGRYPLIPDAHVHGFLIGPGTVGWNAGHLWEVDGTDPRSVSRALPRGRKIAAQIRDAVAECHPRAYANAYLAATAAQLGIRESRRIIGDYVLTMEDYFERRGFPDEICRNSYYIDIHNTREEIEDLTSGKLSIKARYPNYGPGESHGIPYRCLTPRGLRNVLIAGRAISCDRVVQASIRVMPVCLTMGEAAGLAAAHAAAGDADVHGVDTARLRDRLRAEGAYLP